MLKFIFRWKTPSRLSCKVFPIFVFLVDITHNWELGTRKKYYWQGSGFSCSGSVQYSTVHDFTVQIVQKGIIVFLFLGATFSAPESWQKQSISNSFVQNYRNLIIFNLENINSQYLTIPSTSSGIAMQRNEIRKVIPEFVLMAEIVVGGETFCWILFIFKNRNSPGYCSVSEPDQSGPLFLNINHQSFTVIK